MAISAQKLGLWVGFRPALGDVVLQSANLLQSARGVLCLLRGFGHGLVLTAYTLLSMALEW